MVLETLKKLCRRAQFFGKTFFAPKIGEIGQKYPKDGFFEPKEKVGQSFTPNLFHNKNYYLLCF